MPPLWGMFRDQNALLSCVRECAQEARVSVFVPKNEPPNVDWVILLGPLVRLVSPYPFLDIPRHLRRLGVDSITAARYAEGLSRGWCLICIDGQARNSRWHHYPLTNTAILP